MTPTEFKAWFDGFTEAFGGCPTKAQWARIKTRVAEIDGRPITERHYIDRYWPLYRDCYFTTWGSVPGLYGTNLSAMCGNNTAAAQSTIGSSFTSSNAMYALGQAEGHATINA